MWYDPFLDDTTFGKTECKCPKCERYFWLQEAGVVIDCPFADCGHSWFNEKKMEEEQSWALTPTNRNRPK